MRRNWIGFVLTCAAMLAVQAEVLIDGTHVIDGAHRRRIARSVEDSISGLTNSAVFSEAVTNGVSLGSGTNIYSGKVGRVLTFKSISGSVNIAVSDDGTTVTITAVDLVPTSRTITAGDGLTGGGDLTANRTLAVDASVVRTNDVLFSGAVTNAANVGTGSNWFIGKVGRILTFKSIYVSAPITISDDGSTVVIGFDGSQPFNASGATNVQATSIVGTFPTNSISFSALQTNTVFFAVSTNVQAMGAAYAVLTGMSNFMDGSHIVQFNGYAVTTVASSVQVGVFTNNVLVIGTDVISDGSAAIPNRQVAVQAFLVMTTNTAVTIQGKLISGLSGSVANKTLIMQKVPP